MDVTKELTRLECVPCKYPFMPGGPGVETLQPCTEIMRNAAQDVLKEDADVADVFMYGANGGDKACLAELSKYLSLEYGESVASDELMLTAAATQGLHMVLTLLFGEGSPVFVEDPTYFWGYRIIKYDLQRQSVSVPCDDGGMVPEELDRLLTEHKPTDVSTSPHRPYWAAVYMMPVFHNPCGTVYSAERCQALVSVARRHQVLLIAEDIYNLIHFDVTTHAASHGAAGSHGPRRLRSFDKQTSPSEGQGHVLSIGTFSKILAPGLRLGWVEGPKEVIDICNNSSYGNSGGSFNHFVSKLLTSVLRSGVLVGHVEWLRNVYKKRMTLLIDILTENLPDGCKFVKPQGGFFLWLQLLPTTVSTQFLQFTLDKYGLNFLPGVFCSPTSSSTHCVRLSISFANDELVREGAGLFCKAYREFLQLSPVR